MSESDDTDVLLLIPPDLFVLPNNDSDDELDTSLTKPGVVSEIIEHVQSLESRIQAIESRDSSLEIAAPRQGIQHSVSQSSLLSKSPARAQRCLSVPSTPCSYLNANAMRYDRPINSVQSKPKANTSRLWDKHDDLTSPSNSFVRRTPHAAPSQDNQLHDSRRHSSSPLSKLPARRSLFSSNSSRKSTEVRQRVEDMNLVEVERLLREIEMTEQELESKGEQIKDKYPEDMSFSSRYCKDRTAESVDKFADLPLLSNDESTRYASPCKLDYKAWRTADEDDRAFTSVVEKNETKVQENECTGFQESRNIYGSELGASCNSNPEVKKFLASKYQDVASDFFCSLNNTPSKANGSEHAISTDMFSVCNSKGNTDEEPKTSYFKKNNDIVNGDSCLMKSQNLLALSDFWEQDGSKSKEEMLRIKLEEEKLRREHCEYLIQELQKKLLEQQEKVAVAIRVDNKKNSVIGQFQNSWDKLKQKYQNLETEYKSIQNILKNVTEKHQNDITELQTKINKCQNELSQTIDLAAGYKEKSDNLIKEKIDIVKDHADELEKYKTLVQQKENVCEEIREENSKLMEKNNQLNDLLRDIQQDLNKERKKNDEIRNEMVAIHKALDTCGAELTVLRQEKENLQLKLKEETSKCHSLEQNKFTLLAAIDDAKKAEKQAREEANSMVEQQEKVRCELRDVYQKQLDEVVKAKQQEFQTQLDSAEVAFQTELDSRQRAIAECAARKIKTIIDKHQLEINLVEEKNKEEKRLYELQLAQVAQKSSMLEAQLNSQQASKNQLVEQLHSVMQRQWQQALRIISGGNVENLASFQKINVDKFFELNKPTNSDSLNHQCTKGYQDPVKLEPHAVNGVQSRCTKSSEGHVDSLITLTSNEDLLASCKKDGQNDLRRYIQMILDMQQPNDEALKSRFTDSTAAPPPIYREVPKKHYAKKELSIMSEDSVTWHPISETSGADNSEYIGFPQKLGKEQPRTKPPWK